MHIQFLTEDLSSEKLINVLMRRFLNRDDISFNCKSFHGIGKLPKKNNVKEIKDGQLLHDLPIYLRGFNKSLSHSSSIIVVIVDNDDRDTDAFRHQLEQMAIDNNITIDYIFCIAVEELEAWLLGDKNALMTAYPKYKPQLLNSYEQDSICGTWEILADIICPGGLKKLKAESTSYSYIGMQKCEWAEKIGEYMDIDNNQSPSFNYFISELKKRIS